MEKILIPVGRVWNSFDIFFFFFFLLTQTDRSTLFTLLVRLFFSLV